VASTTRRSRWLNALVVGIACFAIGVTLFALRCSGLGSDRHGSSGPSGERSAVSESLPAPAIVTSGPVQIYVTKQFSSSNVRYRYRVANGSAFPIKRVTIGYDRSADEAQLSALPAGWSEQNGTPPGSFVAPQGWSFETTPSEEDTVGLIDWVTHDNARAIVAGQSVSGFEVVVPRLDPGYELGKWTVYLMSPDTPYYTGTLEYENPTAVAGGTSLERDNGIRTAPNPSARGGHIIFSVSRGIRYDVDVFDVRGSLIRKLKNGTGTGSAVGVDWDGRTSSGEKAASGVYFVRVKSGNGEQRFARVVVTK